MGFPTGITESYRQELLREERVYAAVAKAPVVELIGVVAPLGPGVGKRQGETQWKLWFKLVAWRIAGGPVHQSEIMLYQFGAQRSLSKINDTISVLAVMKFRARLLVENEIGTPHALIETHEGSASDAELDAIAAELRKPVVLDEPNLGKFTFNRALERFEGTVDWGRVTVAADFSIANLDEAKERVKVLASVVSRAREWDAWAVREVLPRVHEQVKRWAEDEPPPTKEALSKELRLIGVSLYEGNDLSLLYDVGDHLGGHQAWVKTSISGEFRDVDYIG